MEALTQAETEERIAILKRFRQLLTAQRDRFRVYLDTLDTQKTIIETGTTDELSRHVDLEEKIVGDILAIQKVIEPMQVMYEFAWKNKEAPEVPEIKTVIEHLRGEAKSRWERNKTLLQERMVLIRDEIKELRANPFKKRRSAYNPAAPTMIDIKG
ncbi:MAG: aldehyde dehydrogenase family protein [Spirochaetaceae bacterium]|jgi:uncharacterized small protein (DUF1192 family)|nr:aldehyde dehydrogenase family protein [Spirochaetaceae bacterium]